ncbi:MAG TPA: PPOX class F420-dependent oxidoreductase [Actinoplanes sp.]|jgi:PPOX class probable F420-dependent enzyme|nr:PPOX class F420-dependent oxidoreductase [Actinoplanes sp.]
MTTLEQLGKQKTVLIETRKRDGTWVGTPVSIIVADGRAFFRSYDAAGKSKRLRNFPEVKVAPSTMRGKPTGPSAAGTARLLDEGESAPVRVLFAKKYPLLQGWLVPAAHRLKGWQTLHYELTLESR